MSKQADTFRAIKSLGMTVRKTEYDEFRVNIKGGTEATAYYTNDLDDALATARQMKLQRATARVQRHLDTTH